MQVRALDEAAALVHVFPNVLRLERETWQPAFDHAAELVGQVSCHTVRLPDDLAGLLNIAPALLAALTGRSSRSAA